MSTLYSQKRVSAPIRLLTLYFEKLAHSLGLTPQVCSQELCMDTGLDSHTLHRCLRDMRDEGTINYKAPRGRYAATTPFQVELSRQLASDPGKRDLHSTSIATGNHCGTAKKSRRYERPAPNAMALERYEEMNWEQFLAALYQLNSNLNMMEQAKWDLFCKTHQPADLYKEFVGKAALGRYGHIKKLIIKRMKMVGDQEFEITPGPHIVAPKPLAPKENNEPTTPSVEPATEADTQSLMAKVRFAKKPQFKHAPLTETVGVTAYQDKDYEDGQQQSYSTSPTRKSQTAQPTTSQSPTPPPGGGGISVGCLHDLPESSQRHHDQARADVLAEPSDGARSHLPTQAER